MVRLPGQGHDVLANPGLEVAQLFALKNGIRDLR